MEMIGGPQSREIESTAEEVALELARLGIAPGQRVTVLIAAEEPDDWLKAAREVMCAKVVAEGWSDEDIDRIIEEEREAVHRQQG